jgi:hypothetical protein
MNINRPSAVPLLLTPTANGHDLGSASGFLVEAGTDRYLITNWHVVTGRDSYTGEPMDKQYAAVPDHLDVQFSDHRRAVDVVALPWPDLSGHEF